MKPEGAAQRERNNMGKNWLSASQSRVMTVSAIFAALPAVFHIRCTRTDKSRFRGPYSHVADASLSGNAAPAITAAAARA